MSEKSAIQPFPEAPVDSGEEFVDESVDPYDNDIKLEFQSEVEIIQSKVSQNLRELKKFLQDGGFITEKGDPKSNVINPVEGKSYAIPSPLMEEFFTRLEKCRVEKRMLHYMEKQASEGVEKTGIMIDLDRYQVGKEREITEQHVKFLSQRIARFLSKNLQIPAGSKFHIFCIRKLAPVLCKKDGQDLYKDGLHLIIPDVRVLKVFKKYLIEQFKKRNLLDDIFKDIPHRVPTSDMLDGASYYVPVNFFGSSKAETAAYPLEHAFEFEMGLDDLSCTQLNITDIISGKRLNLPINLTYELSLHHWQPSFGGNPTWLRKIDYDYIAELETELKLMAEKSRGAIFTEEEMRQEEQDISLINLVNPRARTLMAVLNLLDERYAREYALWYRTICAIAHTGTSEEYKTVAKAFSRRCPSAWNEEGFEKAWSEAVRGNYRGAPATFFSIKKWAYECSHAKMAELERTSAEKLIKLTVLQNEGEIQHTDCAKFLRLLCGDKYVTDNAIDAGTGKAGLCWWEFVAPGDQMKRGEIYKWRSEVIPVNLHLYMADRLSTIYRSLRDEIRQNKETAGEESLAKWWKVVEKNFKKSTTSLGNDGYQASTIRQAKLRFNIRGFAEELDSYPDIIGVGNGILKIGIQPEFIRGFHEYKISKYTETEYEPFDPENPCVKRLLAAFHDIFPEDDVFEYMMFHAATGLDFKGAACIFTMCVGGGRNGKTFFAKMIHNTLGGMYCASGKPALLIDRSERAGDANSALMQMRDKRYFYFDEFSKSEHLNDARMKSIVTPGFQSGRDLYGKQCNFQTTCNAIAFSNFDFIVDTTDHGTWRRMYYYDSKVTFTENPDPARPFEKKVDKTLLNDCTNDPKYRSAMLSIMVHYYSRLCAEYCGDLGSVPVPTIQRETAEFRSRQDTLTQFILQMIVVSPNAEPTSIVVISKRYNMWFKENKKNVDQPSEIVQAQLRNSIITDYFKRENETYFLYGHRMKYLQEEQLMEGESYIGRKEAKYTSTSVPTPAPTYSRPQTPQDTETLTYQNSSGRNYTPRVQISAENDATIGEFLNSLVGDSAEKN